MAATSTKTKPPPAAALPGAANTCRACGGGIADSLQEQIPSLRPTPEGRLGRRAASLLTGHFNPAPVRPLDLCSSPGKRRAVNSQSSRRSKRRLSIRDDTAARGVPTGPTPQAGARVPAAGASPLPWVFD